MEYTPDNEEMVPPSAITRQTKSYTAEGERDSFIEQLKEKIRSQAQRLNELESYKMLCEKRVIELCPDHPLPVLTSHLGKSTA